jgi:hypothetical protein
MLTGKEFIPSYKNTNNKNKDFSLFLLFETLNIKGHNNKTKYKKSKIIPKTLK